MHDLRLCITTYEIAIHTHPVHLSTTTYLIFADHRDVIFRDTRDHTRVASSTDVKVDDHTPLVLSRHEILMWSELGVIFILIIVIIEVLPD
jgi:hypothetical protein